MMMMRVAFVLLLAAYAHACGKPSYEPSLTRVVNGVDARPYSWPWQISLQYRSGSSYYHTCGGTLLSPNWILTAGHCIGNDIAMMKLSSPVVMNDKVQAACVPPSGEVSPHNDPCYITGWGRIFSGGPLASKLQQAILPVVGHSVCSSGGWWGSYVKTTMICAGGDIRSGCHGVTSFVSAAGCNTIQKPTVFTRTSSFTQWISDVSLRYSPYITQPEGEGHLRVSDK
ncbi:proproteinase E-like [Scomber scombrus]|uniref:Proproteinase E-like n=1 Tax=Scomber scombrus TaxID=13677 RepID=A0AAV1Q546_SCOSC